MSDLLACLPNIKALISFFLWEQWLPSKRWHTREQQFLIAYLLGRKKKNVQVEIQKVCPEWPEGFLKVAPRMAIGWDLGVGVGEPVSQERWALPRMVEAMVKDELRLEPESRSQDPCNIAGSRLHPETYPRMSRSIDRTIYATENPSMGPLEATTWDRLQSSLTGAARDACMWPAAPECDSEGLSYYLPGCFLWSGSDESQGG